MIKRATVGSYLSVSTWMMLSVDAISSSPTIKTLTIVHVRRFRFIEMLQLTSLIPNLDLTEEGKLQFTCTANNYFTHGLLNRCQVYNVGHA